MDLWAASSLARRLMDEHGLQRWAFRFNHRKRALGLCVHHERRIELSLPFVRANDEELVRDTVLHEIAHALAGFDAGHGPVWKEVCRRIGAKPERCCDKAAMPAGTWRAACPSCGREYHRHRRPARHCTYACRACGHERGALTFRQTRDPVART